MSNKSAHTSNEQPTFLSALFTPLVLDIILNMPLKDCLAHLQTKNEQMAPWIKYTISVTHVNEYSAAFSLLKPRRTIPIAANVLLEALNDVSTRLSGEIKADFLPLTLMLGFGLIILLFVLLTQQIPANFCGAGLAFFILSIGAIIELITQYYAKLSIYTFFKRL
jgi:hypothetical protein